MIKYKVKQCPSHSPFFAQFCRSLCSAQTVSKSVSRGASHPISLVTKVTISRGLTSHLISPTVTKVTIISGGGTILFKVVVVIHSVEITAYSSKPVCSLVLYIWRDEHTIAVVVFNLFSATKQGGISGLK